MDSTNRGNKLQSDSPLESSDQDRLGYADFAEQLAQTVVSRTPSNGYTIGIYGPWGSGKSTILNFVDDQLDDSDSSPAVVRFNPWWFSGQADLIEKFLTQLGATLESEDQFPDIRPQLAKMSSTLSKVSFEPFTGIPIGQGFGALEALLQQEGKGIGELKQEISDELEELDQKTIIIIDDIDRLTPSEISQMFQIIKSIADFPNVVYILAFDHTIVVDALEKEENIRDGEQYLQKIIQLPLHIPTHKQGALESLFLDQLSEIPEDYTVETERWDPLLRKGVMPILQTPREVIRLANTIDVMCVSVGDEVDFVDLVGLETLRVFHSDVYDEIKSSPERFVGHRSLHALSSDEPDDYGDILGKNIDNDEEREAVESILKQLFPFVKGNLADQTSSYSNWNKMRVEKRICHRDRFPIYFRLNIPEGEISDAEMGAIMSVMDDSELLTGELEELLQEGGREESSKAATFIHRLDDRIDNIDPENVTPIVKSIFAIGDQLIQQEQLHAQHREMRSVIFVLKSLLKI
jgi:predicted KAP-like P-loop ATPase